MDRKNKGKTMLTESDTTFNYSPVGLSILVVDDDQESLQKVVTSLRKCKHQYKVAECNQVEDALILLRMDRRGFDIIISEQRLLDMYEFELLRIGREMDLPVIVTSEDDRVDTIKKSLDYGASAYLVKPIPMSVLTMVWIHVYSKRKNKLAQVQQLTNEVYGAKKPRMSWTSVIQEKFAESVQELGGIDKATPMKVLECLQTKGILGVTRGHVSSHLQKYRLKQKKHMMAFEDKDGNSSEHVQYRYEIEMEENPPMTSHIDEVLSTMDRNQLDMLMSQQQGAPAAIKNTTDFQNLQLSVEANSSTIEEGSAINCGNPGHTLNFESNELIGAWSVGYPSLENDIFDKLPSLDALRGGTSGDPSFHMYDTFLSSSYEDCGIESGGYSYFSSNQRCPVGIFENFSGEEFSDDINNL